MNIEKKIDIILFFKVYLFSSHRHFYTIEMSRLIEMERLMKNYNIK